MVRKITISGDELFNKKTIKVEEAWIEQLKSIFPLLCATMGRFLQVDTPYEDESRSIPGSVSSAFSIKPSRDGHQFIMSYSNIHPHVFNRMLRGLVDSCNRYEGMYHDCTTTYLLLAIGFVLHIKNMPIYYAIGVVSKIRDELIAVVEKHKIEYSTDSVRSYIRSAISCLDEKTISAVEELFLEHNPGEITVSRVEFPGKQYKALSDTLYASDAGGSCISLYNLTPNTTLYRNNFLPIILYDDIVTHDTISSLLEKNLDFFQKHAAHSFIIICKFYDSQDSKMIQLLQRYRCVLAVINTVFDDARLLSILANVLGTTPISCIDPIHENTPVLSLSIVPNDSVGKTLIIHNPQLHNFNAGEIQAILTSAYASNSTSDRVTLSRNAIIFKLLEQRGVAIMLNCSSSYARTMMTEKLDDIVGVHTSQVHKAGFCRSFYKCIRENVGNHDLHIETRDFIEFLVKYTDAISFPDHEENTNEYVDLYSALRGAINLAASYAIDMKRTIFAMPENEIKFEEA